MEKNNRDLAKDNRKPCGIGVALVDCDGAVVVLASHHMAGFFPFAPSRTTVCWLSMNQKLVIYDEI
jgi:hypothetical protein